MLGLAYVGLLVCAIAISLVENSSLAATLVIGLALAGVEVYVLTRMAGGFTVAVVPVVTVNAVLLSAPVLWGAVEGEVPIWAKAAGSEEMHIRAALVGIVFCAGYTLGAALVGPKGMRFSGKGLGLASRIRLPNGVLVAVGYVGIFVALYGYQGALIQGRYLGADGPFWAVALSVVATPIAMLVLSVVAVQRGSLRGIALVGIGLLVLICFGRSTRVLALLPMLVIAAKAIVTSERVRTKSVILAVAATGLLQMLALSGRSNPEGVGLVPLGVRLLTRPAEVFTGGGLSELVGNVLLSGPLTAVVSNRSIPSEAFWTSLSPMPGQLAGWVEIKDSLRVNRYTPFNALGEIATQGWLTIAIVGAAVGLLLALATRVSSNLRGAYQLAASLLLLAITIRFSLSLLQYNLRTSARHIWYLLIGLAAIWSASAVFQSRHPARGGQGDPGLANVGTNSPEGLRTRT